MNIDYEALNNWTIDPGFEPQVMRLRLTADGGSETTIIKDQGATTSYWDTLSDGFFNGAVARVYRVVEGELQKLREATVVDYWASEANGYWLSLAETGPPVVAGDIVFLDLVADDPRPELTHERMSFIRRPVSGAWEVTGPATYRRDPTTQAPADGGQTSLRLETETAESISISQFFYGSPESGYPQFVPGHPYRLSVWLKQESLGPPAAQVRFTGDYAEHIETEFEGITDQWQQFTYDFVGPPHPGNGSPVIKHALSFMGPGTLWVDNFTIHDPDYPAMDLVPRARQSLVDFRPGAVRIWSGQTNTTWGTTLENWTNPELLRQLTWDANAGSVMTPSFGLPTALEATRQAGGTPWLIVGNYFDEAEWLGLIEYLAGPAGTEYGDRRIQCGQTRPWSEEFSRIRIEYGNESWNPLFSPWNFTNPDLYSAFAEYFFSVAKSSPYWGDISERIDFIVNGWFIQPDSDGFGVRAVTQSPSASITDITAYVGGWEAGGSVAGDLLSDAGFENTLTFGPREYFSAVDNHIVTQRQLREAGQTYELAVYEGGPGYDLPTPDAPANTIQEIYGKSLAGAVTTLDCFLYNASRGISPQCFFRYQPGPNWASHTSVLEGFRPHPCFLALEMHNRYAGGEPVATRTQSVPVFSATGDQAEAVPLVETYAFRDGDRWSVFALSRSRDRVIPVTLHLPFTAAEGGRQYTLTGSPDATNLVVPTLGIDERDLPPFSPELEFDLPPATVMLFVWANCELPPLPERPIPTVSLHPQQTPTTAAAEARFLVTFTEPVEGFTAADVAVSGDALADTVSVELEDPLDMGAYVVRAQGMRAEGTVQMTVLDEAAMTADGRLSQAPVVLADSVIYSPNPAGNRLLAYDDFNLSPNDAPHPPFLAEATSGAGWAGGWNVQNFVAPDTYGAGYQIALESLPYDGLITTGNHALGGRSYELAGRELDVVGRFGHAIREPAQSPPTIGRLGTTLWLSFLVRKETEAQDECFIYLGRAPLAHDPRIAVGSIFNPETGERRWTLALVHDETLLLHHETSGRMATIGTTDLAVLRCDFAHVTRFRLWINPTPLSSENAPVIADLDVNGTPGLDYSFRSLGMHPGNDVASGAVDEIRIGNSFLSVTPAPGAAPTVTQPPQSQTVALGSEVVLSVSATGDELTYQWRKDGRNIPEATSSTLSFSPFLRADEAVYDVALTTSSVSAMSAPAVLAFTEDVGPPAIVQSPQSIEADLGDVVTFTVEASGLPTPIYQWEKDGVAIGPGTSRMLPLPYALPEDAGDYRVTVSNEHGTVTSTIANLTVTASETVVPEPLLGPYPQAFRPGQTIALSALANGYPPPTWQWQKDGVDILGETSPALVIHGAQLTDAGNYLVIMTNEAGVTESPVAWVRQEHPVSVIAVGPGTADLKLENGRGVSPDDWIAEGQILLLSATPDFAYAFDRWEGDFGQTVDQTSPDITFPLAGPLDLQAIFKDGDWDEDGLPDPWELGIWSAIDAEGAGGEDNPDFDLLSNAQEYALDTNPLQTTLQFVPGWNLFSLPKSAPPGAYLEDQLGAIADLPIWSWEGDAYVRVNTQATRAASQPLEPAKAYWLHTTTPLLLEPTGTGWDNGVADLVPGWNLVGPVQGGELPVQNRLYEAVWFTDVWTWDVENQRYVKVQSTVQSTCGYWLFSTGSPQLVLP
ncbi:MAG: hypothetical protein HN742_07645 [Lentisphaerae bacterium]|nr:hypothetical protein [Lentisphaerota bacterium]MBT5606177.1 hypothetical protein [Lentisphaerota bacterium]MBT7057877.1 hypothetical protein [Lentisphaerota bacterium]MBT7841729.1 hypothetical protein [Lentisphaerota bacterium]